MKITKSVLMLSGSAFSSVNNKEAMGEVYGICSNEGLILIDCGREKSGLEIVKETLSFFEIKVPITHCILTHAHYDHCGNAKKLQDEGALIIVGKEDIDYCINGGSRNDLLVKGEHFFPGFIPDITIEDDREFEANGIKLEFIKVPGHTRGSMVVRSTIDEKIVMFTGDTIQPGGRFLNDINFGWSGDPGYDRQSLKESIAKLSKYDVDIILPGHGNICLCNGSKLLEYALNEAQKLLEDC